LVSAAARDAYAARIRRLIPARLIVLLPPFLNRTIWAIGFVDRFACARLFRADKCRNVAAGRRMVLAR
jgi:hypothetical protein